MRILHVVHSLHAGGMENGIANVATSLCGRDFQIDVVCLTQKGAFARRLPSSSRIFELGKPGRISLNTVIKLRKIIRDMVPDVVHTHNWSGLLYGALATFGLRTALLHGEHAQLTGWERTPRRMAMRRWLYRQFSCVHTVSEEQKAELVHLGIAEPCDVWVLSNGVDCQQFSPGNPQAARKSLGVPESGFYIGMVARCIAEKRHDLLLNGFEIVASKRPDCRLLLAGDGGDVRADVLAMISSHPFSDRIHWLGQSERMPEVYRALNLLVLPSETEGLSNACLEAMASGVPVLANDSCGAREVVNDGVTGFVRPLRSAAALAREIGEMCSDQILLEDLGRGGRLAAIDGFSLQAMVDRYETIYKRVFAGGIDPQNGLN